MTAAGRPVAVGVGACTRRRARLGVVAAGALLASASCGLVAGLEPHELAPVVVAATDAASAIDAASACGPRETVCSGACADLATSALHCGRCGHACGAGYACTPGGCSNEVVEIAASATNGCAVLRGGEVWCWGKNQFGAVGVPPSSDDATCAGLRCRTAPMKIGGLADVAHVSVGTDYACALERNGSVSCWGSNARGYLGHAPTTDMRCATPVEPGAPAGSEPCSPTPRRVALPTGVLAVQVAASSDATCARTMTGDVYCWGNNILGAVGVLPIDAANPAISKPTRVSAITGDATDLSMGGALSHVCVLRTLGTVWCWGPNNNGQLGHAPGKEADSSCIFGLACNAVPKPTPGANATSIAASQGTTCIRTPDGKVSCWGANDLGQLANGGSIDNTAHPVPAVVPGLSSVTRLEMRFSTGFVVDGSATFFAWGSNARGATGLGLGGGIACANGTCRTRPEPVAELASTVAIAATGAGGLALKADGSIWGWGLNDVGQLAHAPGTAGDTDCAGAPCTTRPSQLGTPFITGR